jgi:hypothetical protein
MQGIKKRKAEKRNIHFSALRYEEWKLSLPVEGIRIWRCNLNICHSEIYWGGGGKNMCIIKLRNTNCKQVCHPTTVLTVNTQLSFSRLKPAQK